MIAEKNKKITLKYHFETTDGIFLGSSDKSGPMTFILGAGDVIKGLDNQIQGREQGESFSFTLEPAEAYGEWDESLEHVLPLSDFDEEGGVQVGTRVTATFKEGTGSYYVTEIKDDNATLDGNHPLAGHSLNFKVEILEISDDFHSHHHEDGGSCGCGGGGCGCH